MPMVRVSNGGTVDALVTLTTTSTSSYTVRIVQKIDGVETVNINMGHNDSPIATMLGCLSYQSGNWVFRFACNCLANGVAYTVGQSISWPYYNDKTYQILPNY